ncbi:MULTISPECIES: inorganic phosphate transporter [unclassified Methylobacterium]|jgi:PiT family inorganic phosphate transporter|uniref:inorganic phosphate transporter n=1 Tax=unclassified Methylobacterium TaxID=2615210 RepID=UPI00135466E2|nr:inorganic phosphate transporter [Methylobacterium sp. 2A]MWV24525.1 inorganic phosphate transporter [Methylobacterium sp. 2A]
MSDSAVMSPGVAGSRPAGAPRLDRGIHPGGVIAFLAVLVAGLGYAVLSLIADMNAVGEAPLAYGAFALLGLALLIALGFEFVNGFHDTANAVATVIYTHSLPPLIAVIWSGFFNFLGVLLSSGAVAYAIVTLLPVELILNVGSHAGYAMIFALLLAAIIWNLGTWAFGLPNSSSHALIGSVLGVGLANQLMSGGDGTSGVDWNQALNVFKALLFSPICGFVLAALLLLALKFSVRRKDLYEAPKGDTPPPLWIRGLLILTCTLVSFFHGGNDGQKGMGLIMLILIGAAPTAYALNRTMADDTTPAFVQASMAASEVFSARAPGAPVPEAAEARRTVTEALKTKDLNKPPVFAALAALATDIAASVKNYGAIRTVPAAQTQNLRSDMYLAADAVRLLPKTGVDLSELETGALKRYAGLLNDGTRYIPGWVKICVALALGLGTMVGWKRIVVTVGEKIGKAHLTYAQGASAEIVAAGTIGLAELYGLPVSTTHILSSGVAGTMAANGSGLQMSTVRNMALAWIMTLPAAITLAAGLFFILRHVF